MAMPAASMFAAGRGTSADPPSSPSNRGGLLTDRPNNVQGATSPRSSFLGSFMRGRSRAASVTNAVAGAVRGRVASPTVEAPNPMNAAGESVSRSISSPPATAQTQAVDLPPIDPSLRRTHRIRLVPVLESNRSFTFEPVQREMGVMHVPPGIVPSIAAAASASNPGPTVNGRAPPLLMKIGRFTDRVTSAAAAEAAAAAAAATSSNEGGATSAPAASGNAAPGAAATANGTTSAPAATSPALSGGGGGDLLSSRAAFRSKVVSRSHAEIWCEPGGKFYIRDTASSSGTFLNHIRLSSPNVQSRPQLLKDGDVLQLGVDYQGGAEEMYRCVKMRVEVGREWQQRGASEFNKKALKQLTELRGEAPSEKSASVAAASYKVKGKASVTDCCICLFSVAPAQSLFIAPCSHVYHYKCIRPLLMQHHPGFSCPLCRTYANLDEDVEIEDAWETASRRHSVRSKRNSTGSLRPPAATAQQADSAEGSSAAATAEDDVADVLGELSINGVLAAAEADEPPAELARQVTAVPERSSASSRASVGSGTPLGTPQASGTGTPAEGVEDDDTTPSRATVEPMTIGSGSGRASESRASVSASLAQTPMNDVFLSTLVPSQATGAGAGAARDDASVTPAHSASASSLRVTPEIPEEPAAEAAAAGTGTGAAPSIASTDERHGERGERGERGQHTDSETESHQYLLLED